MERFKDTSSQPSRREIREARRRKGGGALEFLLILAISFALVFGVVRPFIVEAFYIPSESMEPTLQVNDRVLAAKFVYYFTTPERGDIVVFRSVENPDEDLIKRVIGLPGDTVAIQGGTLFVNGQPRQEPYVARGVGGFATFGPVTVPEGHYFMMGDNRSNSQDSRVFGPVPEENLIGDAFLRFWPPGRIGLI
ncbi:signal peptidase I [Rubrobacter taiwanensis]|jgi:signal peptidase I|uniref:Signal peptidase I n=1 Tax=Rubrobacter taiwanensis TaxID=185139 RepID=A0A4R1BRY3_9ACTN|nr:signal peptidase I [Rubrobacter taiwanensis]TCJ20524.1 signal peptidase I [Rubrobacter taiwanensis]